MADDAAPPILGTAGLTGRADPAHGNPAAMRSLDFEADFETGARIPAVQAVGTMPSNCRRVQASPLPPERGGGCMELCAGRQRNGGCLLDVVRAAVAAGIRDWRFEIDPTDLFWDYAGPPIPGYTQERGERPGAVVGRWDPGAEPAEPYTIAEQEPPSYDCPHCGVHVVQDLANFHFWCPACGRNANDSPEAS